MLVAQSHGGSPCTVGSRDGTGGFTAGNILRAALCLWQSCHWAADRPCPSTSKIKYDEMWQNVTPSMSPTWFSSLPFVALQRTLMKCPASRTKLLLLPSLLHCTGSCISQLLDGSCRAKNLPTQLSRTHSMPHGQIQAPRSPGWGPWVSQRSWEQVLMPASTSGAHRIKP